ncbi:hypothetical protein J4476_02215 [Candidatus Woesearchaeota archaeon]|nr:MAG: hypothetical protein QT09_C0007G0034 [archaeon GW2011_AR18]MBS3161487.1 hypothetical protein [Candidatus Woesearchaeota archaeon]HIH25468.1 hypothetical protein [Nanoarchaeota archaeon]
MDDLNKHTIAILHAIAHLGRTSIFEMNSIEEQGLNAGQSHAKLAIDNWTKKLYDDLVVIMGENHPVVSKFREEWNIEIS